MADDDLDEQFALFERHIQTVSAKQPFAEASTVKAASAPVSRARTISSTSLTAPRATGGNPPRRARSPTPVEPVDVRASAADSTDHPSHFTSLRRVADTDEGSGISTATNAPTATTTGRWKWDGSAWKWLVTSGVSSSLSAQARRAPGPVASVQPVRPGPGSSAANNQPVAHFGPVAPVSKPPVKRTSAGEVWRDESLAEWPSNDHRIFVGDLAPDALEAELEQAFSRYKSFNMAKVVRDKRSGLCKGYGFVSFAAGEDMIAALKEMNGKYVGARPVKLRKSNWQKRNLSSGRRKEVKLMKEIVKRR